MALAMTGGSLVAASLAITPTSALDPSITLSPDNSTIELPISASGSLAIAGHTLTITTTGELIGYNVTLSNQNKDNNAMVDKDDANKKILSITGANQSLTSATSPTYGYTLSKVSNPVDSNGNANDTAKGTIWNEVPLSTNPVSIKQDNTVTDVDQTRTDTIDIAYGANLAGIKSGNYETKVVYTATVTPMPTPPGGEICQSGNSDNNCQVDIDANMIPVKYTGGTTTPKWTAIANPEDASNKGEWYDYGQRQWANAVTLDNSKKAYNVCGQSDGGILITRDATTRAADVCRNLTTPLAAYKTYVEYKLANKPVYSSATLEEMKDFVIDPSDILGYWVYIPRYAYQVMRRDATDKVVTDTEASAMGGFNIRFQKSPSVSTDTKDRIVEPKKCDNSNANQYYQDCVGKWNAWATHPAFRWCTDINYTTGERSGCTELNGIWVGKFETTGTADNPTVLPNTNPIHNTNIGDMFDIAKSIGTEDNIAKNYGNGGNTFGKHNLVSTTSHMLKNSEWGAAAYLSASKYGAGVDGVQINSYSSTFDYTDTKTGCGPKADGDIIRYNTACNRYNTELGQKASTTNNITGLYDMRGSLWEYVTGSYSDDSVFGSSQHMDNPARLPYVDLYPGSVFTENSYTNNNQCTWATCGGHALNEVKNVQLTDNYNQSWERNYSDHVTASPTLRWFRRGAGYFDNQNAGLFASDGEGGNNDVNIGFRTALLVIGE